MPETMTAPETYGALLTNLVATRGLKAVDGSYLVWFEEPARVANGDSGTGQGMNAWHGEGNQPQIIGAVTIYLPKRLAAKHPQVVGCTFQELFPAESIRAA